MDDSNTDSKESGNNLMQHLNSLIQKLPLGLQNKISHIIYNSDTEII